MSINKGIRLLSTVYLVFLLCSCSSFEEWEEEPVKQTSSSLGVPMRTMVCISKCVDYYVTVGNYSVYKDTYCWNEYYPIGGGGTGDYYTGGEYDPGDFNVGNATTENKSHYTFDRLQELYGIGSNLNMAEKEALNSMINAFKASCVVYPEVYNLLLSTKVKIKFVIDPNCKYPAHYLNKVLTIKNIKALELFQLTEELLHAVQDLCFYQEQMEPAHKNCEFEAKVFQDLVYKFYTYTGFSEFPLITDERPEFGKSYRTWLDELEQKKCFTASDQSYFNYLCNEWQGYGGNYNPNFRPQLLLRFFSKPPVDHQ